MPGDDILETFMRVVAHAKDDSSAEIEFDKAALKELMDLVMKELPAQEVLTEFPKAPPTGRRAAIAAQKARKANAAS